MKSWFDQEIREALRQEPVAVPSQIHLRTEQLLAALPEKKAKHQLRLWPRMAAAAAVLLLVMLVLLPNVSPAYAQAIQKVPVIGKLVQVLTIRNYFYADDSHELDVSIPAVRDPENAQAGDLINKDVDELTDAVIRQFYQEREIANDKGYGSIYIDYETITNTPQWFTLKLTICEIAGSSNTYAKIYHIDRTSGNYITFGDLFEEEGFAALEETILAQMEAQMKADPHTVYWTDKTDLGVNITALDEEQNFYFNEEHDLVIVFDKYEVGPGSMGCPEFKISPEIYEQYRKDSALVQRNMEGKP